MLEGIGTFFGALKQASPFLFLGFALASGIVLFGSEFFLATLGLDQLRLEYRGLLGAAFVLSISLLAAHGIWSIAGGAKSVLIAWWKKRKEVASLHLRQANLQSLTPDEKAYLIPYIRDKQNTQYFQLEDGISNGLQAKGVLYRSASVGSMITGFAFNIQPWAREYLEHHPELLNGASKNPNSPRPW